MRILARVGRLMVIVVTVVTEGCDWLGAALRGDRENVWVLCGAVARFCACMAL